MDATFNLASPVDGLVITDPCQEHYGLLRDLPLQWPVWSGAASEVLTRMTASLSGAVIEQRFHTCRHHEAFAFGPFTITPCMTDHSARRPSIQSPELLRAASKVALAPRARPKHASSVSGWR